LTSVKGMMNDNWSETTYTLKQAHIIDLLGGLTLGDLKFG